MLQPRQVAGEWAAVAGKWVALDAVPIDHLANKAVVVPIDPKDRRMYQL